MTAITASEMQMLQGLRVKADELALMMKQAQDAGFTVQFNINGVIGACDVFNVFRLVPVDLRSGAN